MAELNLPQSRSDGDDVWGADLNETITAINDEVEAATAAVATKAADNAVVKLTGSQTITGPKNYTTLTVATVPVATTEDLEDYVPVTQAATFDLSDYNVGTDTGDVVITAGGKAFTFTYLDGELQGGMGGDDDPDPDFEALITNEWGHASLPTTNSDWTATVGSVVGDFALDLNTSNAWGTTGYDAAAFGGKHGFVLQNDAFAADFTTARSLDPGTGWGCAYVIMDDWGIDSSDIDGQERNVIAVQDASRAMVARVRLRLNNTGAPEGAGKTYSWVISVAGQADIVVSVGALSGLNGPSQVIENATSVAMHFKGSSSYMAINGTQVGSTFDATGLTARWLDLNPHGGDGPRGYGDYWSWGWTISGMTEAQTKAWVADRLAAAVA